MSTCCVAMDHPKYHQYREGFLDASDWHYLSSSDEADNESDLDGLLTPVSMTRHCGISNPLHTSSAHLIHDSLLKKDARKNSAIHLRQRKPCSSSPRRPITRSYGNDCVSLDYRRKGFVIYRPATKNISMTFQIYLKYYVCGIVSRICYSTYSIRISSERIKANRLNNVDTTFAEGWKWLRSRRE